MATVCVRYVLHIYQLCGDNGRLTNQSPGGALMVVKTCPNCGHKYIVSDIDPEEDCKKCGGEKDVRCR